jgi:hypothetical protein
MSAIAKTPFLQQKRPLMPGISEAIDHPIPEIASKSSATL